MVASRFLQLMVASRFSQIRSKTLLHKVRISLFVLIVGGTLFGSFQNCAPSLPQDGIIGAQQASSRPPAIPTPQPIGELFPPDDPAYVTIDWEGICEQNQATEPMALNGMGDSTGGLIAFSRSSDGAAAFWNVTTQGVNRGRVCRMISPGWKVKAIEDFDGDFFSDVLWRHTDGRLVFWKMRGAARVGGGPMSTTSSPTSRIVGAGDFNADGKKDLLWSHSSGAMSIWFMNGANQPTIAEVKLTSTGGTTSPMNLGPEWVLQGISDFNADNKADVLWRHRDTGVLSLWRMNGEVIAKADTPKYLDGNGTQQILSPSHAIISVGDYGGDGKADLMIKMSNNTLVVWKMNEFENPVGSTFGGTLDAAYKQLFLTSDVDGDRKSDIFWLYQQDAPSVTVWKMQDSSSSGIARLSQIGLISNGWLLFNYDSRID